MNVLSTFDGYSSLQIALNRLGHKNINYYASEIDPHPMKVTQANYPNTVQLGSVAEVKAQDLPRLDLVAGGSPCQGFSFAGKQLNFEDPRSALFFEFVRLLTEARVKNPNVSFLLENVKMKKQYQDIISMFLGVEPIGINSGRVSAGSRPRLYWTNISGITVPPDSGLTLADILEENPPESFDYFIGFNAFDYVKAKNPEPLFAKNGKRIVIGPEDLKTPMTFRESRTDKGKAFRKEASRIAGRDVSPRGKDFKEYTTRKDGKANCLVTVKSFHDVIIDASGRLRYLTPIEKERIQTVPENYTAAASPVQREKMLGNGWTIDVIEHILRHDISL